MHDCSVPPTRPAALLDADSVTASYAQNAANFYHLCLLVHFVVCVLALDTGELIAAERRPRQPWFGHLRISMPVTISDKPAFLSPPTTMAVDTALPELELERKNSARASSDDAEKHSLSADAKPDLEKDVVESVSDEHSVSVIQNAEDVAVQVLRGALHPELRLTRVFQVISTEDDPTLPVFTFRVIVLGVGLSAFGSVRTFS